MGCWRTTSSDEPLTPLGRTFTLPGNGQVVHLAVGMKHRIDAQAVKEAMKDSVMVNHPRFCSLMVRDARGVEHWRRTRIDIDCHVIVVDDPVGSEGSSHASGDDDESAVNDYVADMSLMSLDYGKPLWEFHVLSAHNCIVMRMHHALGDGVSLLSMLLTLCSRVDDPDSLPTITSSSTRRDPSDRQPSSSWCHTVKTLAHRVWLTLVFTLRFTLRFWVRDPKSPITGGDGIELWPRKLATARFLLDDMKLIKRFLPGATINDVLTGVISLGLCRYLNTKQPGSGQHRLTGLAAVSLRKQPGLHENITDNSSQQWGNLVGVLQLSFPTTCNNRNNPLGHVIGAKEVLDQMKSSYVAAFSYWLSCMTMTCFGGKVAAYLRNRVMCNTTFDISNLVGPQERLSYLGNPITYIKGCGTSNPHSLTLQMVSYTGRANLQVLVAKDIIPDPDFLAECFEGALKDMKAAVEEEEEETLNSLKED